MVDLRMIVRPLTACSHMSDVLHSALDFKLYRSLLYNVPGTALQGPGITCNGKQAQSRAASLYNRKAQSHCGRSAACSHVSCLFLG